MEEVLELRERIDVLAGEINSLTIKHLNSFMAGKNSGSPCVTLGISDLAFLQGIESCIKSFCEDNEDMRPIAKKTLDTLKNIQKLFIVISTTPEAFERWSGGLRSEALAGLEEMLKAMYCS